VMDTWRVGRRVYAEKVREGSLALDLFLERADKMTQRVAGTAIFMSARSDMVPGALLHSLKHFKVMHERVVLATVTAADTPFVPASRRIAVEKLGKGFFITRLVYGFFESPDIPQDLALARAHGLALEMDQSTYFLGRETLVPGEHPSLSRWRVALYMWLASNAQAPARFYHLPPGRVVELGTQVTI
jgi:KUP system potassium uptake protein